MGCSRHGPHMNGPAPLHYDIVLDRNLIFHFYNENKNYTDNRNKIEHIPSRTLSKTLYEPQSIKHSCEFGDNLLDEYSRLVCHF